MSRSLFRCEPERPAQPREHGSKQDVNDHAGFEQSTRPEHS